MSVPRSKRRSKVKPIEVKRGSVTVRIYPGKNSVGGRSYTQFTLIYWLDGKRVRQRFAQLESARREAERVATAQANGQHAVLRLTSAEQAMYLQACEQLRPLNIPLNLAVADYVGAVQGMPEGTTLKEAVDFFKRRNPVSLPQKPVREVVDELLAAKHQAGRSLVHLNDLEYRLGRFAGDFQMSIGGISGTMLQAWLNGMKGVGGRTKRNFLRQIGLLFRFAVKRHYLPKDALEELEAVEQPEQDDNPVEIFTPAELRELFAAARPELVPWLAIAAFAGLRNAELQRLDWSEIDLTSRHIEVTARKSKTRSRRLAPVTDNLYGWLAPLAQKGGPVSPFVSIWNQIKWLTDDVNSIRRESKDDNTPPFRWKHNGLRHGFCSYRLAILKDVAQVSLEAGNSPQMIFANYRKVVTETSAQDWFNIAP